jgi:hypothetical protein
MKADKRLNRRYNSKQRGFIINPFLTDAGVQQPNVDPYWNLSQLQLNGDEANIIDRSPGNCNITLTGAVSVSNSKSRYGTTSIFVPSNGNIKAYKDHSFSYGYGDFELHIDVWFENDVATDTGFIKLQDIENSGRLWFIRKSNGAISFDLYGVGGSATSVYVPSGQWNSIVLGRIDQWVYVGINSQLIQMPYITGTDANIGNTSNGSIILYGAAGGTGGVYFNNFRVLSSRNYLYSNLATSYTPPTAFYAKQGVDTAIYDPMWKNVLFRLPLNTDTGLNDVSDYNRYVVPPSNGSVATNVNGHGNGAYTVTAADGSLQVLLGVPTWSNWALEVRMSWGLLTNGDKRVYVILNTSGSPIAYVQLAANASGSMYSYIPEIGGYYHFGFTPLVNVIYNICIEKTGRYLRLFVDGVYKGQAITGASSIANVGSIIVGGSINHTTGQTHFIDDVRFTLGTRYTGMTNYNATLPIAHTQQFPTQGYSNSIPITNNSIYSDDVLLDNPLFYYRLNEPSGTITVDSSGNARNGTYVGSPKLQVNGLLENQTVNKAVVINGKDNYINVPYGAWMNVGNNIALEAIIKLSTMTSDTIISRRFAVVGSHIFHFRIVNGYLTLIVFNSGGGWYTWYAYNYLLSIDTKYHAVVTFNGSLIKFYINGRLIDQSYLVISLPNTASTAIDIGRNTSVVSPFEPYYGVIDEVAMYGNVLPYNRITSHAINANLLLTDNTLTKALSTAVCIIALRVLKPGYTGSLIKVRRSSDNTELVIGSLNGELDTVSLLNFVGVGNGFVSIWYDQSGTGNNYTQATLASQPLIVTNGELETYNGKPCLKFSNNAFMNSGQILDNNYHFTINFLTDTVVLAKGRDGSGAGWGFYLDSSGNSAGIVLTAGGTVNYAVTGVVPVTGFKTRRVQYIHGTTSYLKIYNGEDINNEITQAKYTLRSSTIGMEMGRLNAGYTAGRSAELVIHTSLLPDYLSDVIRNSQNSYYGL